MTAAVLVLLGLSGPLRAPDLQVEAMTAAGVDLPELADAVARALAAGGARVVLQGPVSERCTYCAKVAVIEIGPGTCRIDASQDRHSASATLHFPAGSPLFDRARAIAIQARLLVSWETSPDSSRVGSPPASPAAYHRGRVWEPSQGSHLKNPVDRASTRKIERKTLVGRSLAEPQVATVEPTPPPAGESELASGPPPEPVPAQIPTPVPSRPQRATSAEVSTVSIAPPKPRWPWIPTVIGSGAAVGAGICAIVARDRYDALSDKSRPYQTAQALKAEGQSWQVASLVLSGVAVVGLTTGLIGFVTRSPKPASVAALAAPIPGGGMIAIAGDLP